MKLKECAVIKSGCLSTRYDTGGGEPYRMLTPSCIDKYGRIDFAALKTISSRDRLTEFLTRQGDVILRSAITPNYAFCVTEETSGLLVSSRFAIIRVLPAFRAQVCPAYLAWLMNGGYLERQFEQNRTGSTVVSLKIKNLADLEFPVPPVDVQAEIAEAYALSLRKITLQKEKLKLLEEENAQLSLMMSAKIREES